eukprot:scaffold15736_cov71-Phaeocystis_antarctica.AAC.2
MVRVAQVVVGLAPYLPAVRPAEGVVQRVVDEEVPRLVPSLAVRLRDVAQRVKHVTAAARQGLLILEQVHG